MGKLTEQERKALAEKFRIAREAKIIRTIEGVGYIEDVYGTGTSFNVYRYAKSGEGEFYGSAYTIGKAIVTLDDLKKKKQEDENRR